MSLINGAGSPGDRHQSKISMGCSGLVGLMLCFDWHKPVLQEWNKRIEELMYRCWPVN